MIELYIDSKQVDLTGTEQILADYQIGSLANISEKDTTRTIEFELPPTQNNLGIFLSPNVALNGSRLPYRMLDAYLLDDGVDMKIYKCQFLGIKKNIRVRLYGNNTSFINAMRDLSIRDLDLSTYDHIWEWANIEGLLTSTEGVAYPLIDYGDMDTAGNQIYLEQMFCAVYLLKIMEQICADRGYTLTGNWMLDTYVQKWHIPFCNDKTQYHDGYQDDYVFKAGEAVEDIIYSPGAGTYIVPQGAIVKFETEVSDPGSNYGYDATIGGWVFTTDKNFVGTFHVKLSLRIVGGPVSDYNIRLYRVRDGVEALLEAWNGETEVLDDGIGVDIDRDMLPHLFKSGDQVYLRANLVLSGVLTYLDFKVPGGFDINGNANDYIELVQADPYGPLPGDLWEVAANLPDIKQTDIYTFILAYFGCLGVVDEEAKEVNISFFNTIPGNKANAQDWSGMMDTSEDPEISFLVENYARLNHCKFLDEDDLVKPLGTDYDIVLDNETLVPELDLFTAPFGASLMNYKLDQLLNISVIDLQVVDYQAMKKVQPRIMLTDLQTIQEVDFVLNGSVLGSATNVNVSYFLRRDKPVSAGWEWSASLYMNNIIAIMNSMQVIGQFFRLKPGHINQIDWLKPVWVDELQMYFVLSLVEEFEYGGSQSTFVHLITIPEDGSYYG